MNFLIPGFPDFTYGSIFCIGRNYADHIKEMKSSRTKDPVVFLKPRSSIIHTNGEVVIPQLSDDVHHEAEMVLLVGSKGKNLSADNAREIIKAIGIGIDFTARDLQSEAKQKGKPWTLSKGFDTFAAIGNFVEPDNKINPGRLNISLSVNGEVKQNDSTELMIFSIEEIVSYLSHQFTLYPGDLIFTGTPKGVSSVTHGDRITATLGDRLSTLSVHVK
jgi:2-keto-4-pentenoate hydratase/2-oxohepta-3-ene-1,7-dioic acid hydratase in catechol pathway